MKQVTQWGLMDQPGPEPEQWTPWKAFLRSCEERQVPQVPPHAVLAVSTLAQPQICTRVHGGLLVLNNSRPAPHPLAHCLWLLLVSLQHPSQVVFVGAAEGGRGPQPASAPEGPEEGPAHGEVAEEGPTQLRVQEQRPPARPGKKQSSWTPQEGPRELQVDQAPARPGQELERPPSVQGQPPRSCQGPEHPSTPGHQAADRSDIVEPADPCRTPDSCGPPLGAGPPQEAGIPHIRAEGAPAEPPQRGPKDSSQDATLLIPTEAPEERLAHGFLPSTPGEGGEAVETQPAPAPLPAPVRDMGERREPDHAQNQPEEPAGAQGPEPPRQGFMKCLLAVGEEEEAAHRRASRARAPPGRKLPRTPTPVPISAPSLPLPQMPASAPATASPWTRSLTPGPGPAPAGAPVAAVRAPWRKTELLHGGSERTLSSCRARQEPEDHGLRKLCQSWEERPEERLTLRQEEAFRSYFEMFNGPGEVDAQSLKNILLLVGFSLTPAQVEDALMSADVDGDGHVDFKDFLAVMTDTRRFFCSVEQNAPTDMALPNPHTLLFEILSLLVEMLALPEAALEEITNYYQKKLKEGTYKAREVETAIGRLRAQKLLPTGPQPADGFEVPERRVLRLLSRLKQQNYAANLQSPYAQVPCIPLCPRLDKKIVQRKQGSHFVLDQYNPSSLGPDIRGLFFQPGSQGKREYSSDSRKWLSSVSAQTH
nr:spermatogenesis-associated protein 21 isoform X2 [Oryctolagus cuniculus]